MPMKRQSKKIARARSAEMNHKGKKEGKESENYPDRNRRGKADHEGETLIRMFYISSSFAISFLRRST
jgi:hypothetical protein